MKRLLIALFILMFTVSAFAGETVCNKVPFTAATTTADRVPYCDDSAALSGTRSWLNIIADLGIVAIPGGGTNALIYYDQTGVPHTIALGAYGYVLKAQGVGSAPIFEAITPGEIGAQSQDADLTTLATGSPWQGFYRDGSGIMQPQAFGPATYVWTSNGPSAAPTWQAPTGGSGGATTFLGLTDTPSAYTGHAGDYVRVNGTSDGTEFATPSAAPWMYPITKDTPVAATYRWFKAPRTMTVAGLDVILAAGDTGSITVDVQECSATGTSCVSILSAPVTASATGAAATITDTSIAADAWVQIIYGTPTGTVSQVAGSLKGTY